MEVWPIFHHNVLRHNVVKDVKEENRKMILRVSEGFIVSSALSVLGFGTITLKHGFASPNSGLPFLPESLRCVFQRADGNGAGQVTAFGVVGRKNYL